MIDWRSRCAKVFVPGFYCNIERNQGSGFGGTGIGSSRRSSWYLPTDSPGWRSIAAEHAATGPRMHPTRREELAQSSLTRCKPRAFEHKSMNAVHRRARANERRPTMPHGCWGFYVSVLICQLNCHPIWRIHIECIPLCTAHAANRQEADARNQGVSLFGSISTC